jgi:hypothetical protein
LLIFNSASPSNVTLTQIGPDRVRVDGATGRQRPDQLKVTVGHRDGFMGEGQISYAGLGAQARGQLALNVLQIRLADVKALDSRFELMGVNAIHGQALADGYEPYEVRARAAVRVASRQDAERIGHEVEALYLNGPASGGGVTQSVREVIAAASVLIPREWVQTSVTMLEV